MKRHFYILVTGALLLVVQACNNTKDVETKLHKADVYMDEHPELALEALEAIDTGALTTRETQAKYALLYSMALDKNYIDVTNDSIIAPAAAYYKNNGTPDDKLKTYYYLGRIAMNMGDYENAMTHFVKAEQYAVKCNDLITTGLLYNAKMHVYNYLYDTENLIEAAQKSASAFLLAKDTTRYLTAVNGVLTGYLQAQDTINAGMYLNKLKQFWPSLTTSQKSKYYSGMLFLYTDKDDLSRVSLLKQYLNDIDNPEIIQWIPVAETYFHLGQYEDASLALSNYLEYGGENDAAFYYISALVHERMEDYKSALDSYKLYVNFNSKRDADLYVTDARFIEERIDAETRLLRKNYTIIIVVLTLFIVLLLVIIIGGRVRKGLMLERKMHKVEMEGVERRLQEEQLERQELEAEKDKYMEMYNATCKDIKRLKKTLQENKLDKDVCRLVEERLNVLNNFVAANISGSFTTVAYNELARLMADQAHFLNSTRASFHIAHPQFLAYLKKNGLSEEEIEYCCLYCIGLNGSEILAYLNKPSIYNVSAVLRKKLDVEKKVKIDVFLQKKMQEFD